MSITIVPDEPCPACGAVADHPDESLRFMNRPKVSVSEGVWAWKCYNPRCPVAYYEPQTGELGLERCKYFLLCDQPAIKCIEHPLLGPVPTCQRCSDKIDALA